MASFNAYYVAPLVLIFALIVRFIQVGPSENVKKNTKPLTHS